MSKDPHVDNQHVVARLESFSDIVIGFSLAQTAFNLVVTGTVESFFAHPIGILAYLVTFFFVARMWWTHSQIMHRFFEPNRLMITLNFVALAALGLMVFGLQLWLHRGNDLDGQLIALRFYFLMFSLTLGTMATMRAIGVRYRWSHLSPAERRAGAGQSIATIATCVAIMVGIFTPTIDSFFGFSSAPMPANVLYAILFGAIVGRFVRLMLQRSHWGESLEAAHA